MLFICVSTSDVNDTELLVFDAEPRLSFSVKKNEHEPNRDSSKMSTIRDETLTNHNRAEIMPFVVTF